MLGMMYTMRDIIASVEDPNLRQLLERAFEQYNTSRVRYGLNFESHQEYRLLTNLPIRVGDTVQIFFNGEEDYFVRELNPPNATIENTSERIENIPIHRLTRVSPAGEVTFPTLQRYQGCGVEEGATIHTLIEGDNLDVLHLLTFSQNKSYDVIYLDPPYGSGSTRWTYNNRFVDADDNYKHSKWISMMDHRLRMAKKLLRDDGTLVLAIDDYHHHRLRLLVERIFPGWKQHVVAVRHAPGGGMGAVSRIHEYALILMRGQGNTLYFDMEEHEERWDGYFRRGAEENNWRTGRPGSFFPILVHDNGIESGGYCPIVGVEAALGNDEEYIQYQRTESGHVRVYPNRADRGDRVWRNNSAGAADRIAQGSLRCRLSINRDGERKYSIQYRSIRQREKVRSIWGEAETQNGVTRAKDPTRYNAGTHGTELLKTILGLDEVFSYSKSLYTLYDILEATTRDNPNAKILDFFAGSGTTAHATMLLNSMDGGERKCTLVTNNEMHIEDVNRLLEQGYSPGIAEWDNHGNSRRFTFPRLSCAIQGIDLSGEEIDANYLTQDSRVMSIGFPNQGIQHFLLAFNDPLTVALGNCSFGPDLGHIWMISGGVGSIPESANVGEIGENSVFVLINRTSEFSDLSNRISNGELTALTHIFIGSSDENLFRIASARFTQYTVISMKNYCSHFQSRPIPAHSGGMQR